MNDSVRLAQEAQAIFKAADANGRPLTADERVHVEDLLERATDAHNLETKMADMGDRLGAPDASAGFDPPFGRQGPGDVFIQSAGYKAIKDPTARSQTWSSGMVDVTTGGPALNMKGTLLETTAGGPGGGLVPPYNEPGIVSKLFEPLGVSDLFGQSQTTGGQVRYVNEGTATSGAAGVAEAAAKPESTLVFSEVVEPVRKIATILPISDEMLEDAPSVQAYLNGRLSLFVRIEEERQLLRGVGGGSNELVGIVGRCGVNTYSRGTDDNSVALAKTIANTAGSANLAPDGIVMHPSNYLSTRLLRDNAGTAGAYLGGGPFGQPYGGPSVGLFGAAIWGLPVVLNSTIGLGTALVGAFGLGAHVWRRGGVSVEASNSHSDYFIAHHVPYDLRHSFASLLLHEGRSVIYVARQLGHDATLTLKTYGHVIDELEDQPAVKAEDAIRAARDKAAEASARVESSR